MMLTVMLSGLAVRLGSPRVGSGAALSVGVALGPHPASSATFSNNVTRMTHNRLTICYLLHSTLSSPRITTLSKIFFNNKEKRRKRPFGKVYPEQTIGYLLSAICQLTDRAKAHQFQQMLLNSKATPLSHGLDDPFHSLTGELGDLTATMAQQVVPTGAVRTGVAVTIPPAMDAAGQAQLVQRLQRAIDGDQTQGWVQGATALVNFGRAQVPVILLQNLQHGQSRLSQPVTRLPQCLGHPFDKLRTPPFDNSLTLLRARLRTPLL